jgi:hypothetical protein
MRLRFAPLLLLGAALIGSSQSRAQNLPDYERPPVSYSTKTPQDAVTRLQQRLATGDLALAGTDQEIVRAVLRELHVSIESQVMVFSKTSLQRGRIRPDNPRALYFSDTVYVGWVPGGLIEVAAIDPQLGPVFYTFNPRPPRGARTAFVRDADCLRCHGGNFVRDVPGVFARSVVPAPGGEPLLHHGSEVVDDRTPFERRWGGWYVTGYTGPTNHRGNAFGTEDRSQLAFPLSDERPLDLTGLCDTSRYPAKTSDVVALLLLEHQMGVQNSLTAAGQRSRRMLAYQRSLQETFKEPVTDEPTFDSVKSVFFSLTSDVVDHLLFHGAAPLPEGVVGSEAFRRMFPADAARSQAGHALKDLRLRERLLENRCSYLIYSESFTALPAPLKARILDRLHAALHDTDPQGRYAYLEAEEKRRIHDILIETHPDAQERWPAQDARRNFESNVRP